MHALSAAVRCQPGFRGIISAAMRLWLVWTMMMTTVATPQQLLTAFRPSDQRNESGAVSEVEFSTGLVELESGSLAHHVPQAMKNLRFAERVWIVGYKTDILDVQGRLHVRTTSAIRFWPTSEWRNMKKRNCAESIRTRSLRRFGSRRDSASLSPRTKHFTGCRCSTTGGWNPFAYR